jgi:hypothetical protein
VDGQQPDHGTGPSADRSTSGAFPTATSDGEHSLTPAATWTWLPPSSLRRNFLCLRFRAPLIAGELADVTDVGG